MPLLSLLNSHSQQPLTQDVDRPPTPEQAPASRGVRASRRTAEHRGDPRRCGQLAHPVFRRDDRSANRFRAGVGSGRGCESQEPRAAPECAPRPCMESISDYQKLYGVTKLQSRIPQSISLTASPSPSPSAKPPQTSSPPPFPPTSTRPSSSPASSAPKRCRTSLRRRRLFSESSPSRDVRPRSPATARPSWPHSSPRDRRREWSVGVAITRRGYGIVILARRCIR